MTRVLVLGLLSILAASLQSGCDRSSAPDAENQPRKIVRVSQRNEPADLDPATASLPDEFFIIRALGEGLLLPNPDGGDPLPGLAERYDVSPDGLRYTFHLREGLQWSNGEPLTAQDLAAAFRRVLTPSTAAPKAHLFFDVKNARAFATGETSDFSTVGIQAVDAHTLIINLETASPRFPHYVASGPWIPTPPRVVAAHGRTWTQPEHHVGNGPFVLAEWRPQQRIVVRKNPRYHDAARIRISEMQFLRFDSGDTEERAFRAGQVDVTMDVPKTRIAHYTRELPSEIHRRTLAETRFIAFNTRRRPLDDFRVRRALAMAIDRRQLVERVVLGGQTPAHRFLSPTLASPSSGLHEPPSDSLHRHASARARELLAAAGFPAGKDFPRLELTAWSSSQLPVLEALQEAWRRELGIEIRIALREAKVHLSALASGTYDLAFVTTLLDVADPLMALRDFTTDAANNFPHWESTRYDQLLARAAKSSDPASQDESLVLAESLLLDESPVTPLYFNVQNWLMSPRIHGWQQDAFWNRDYRELDVAERLP